MGEDVEPANDELQHASSGRCSNQETGERRRWTKFEADERNTVPRNDSLPTSSPSLALDSIKRRWTAGQA